MHQVQDLSLEARISICGENAPIDRTGKDSLDIEIVW